MLSYKSLIHGHFLSTLYFIFIYLCCKQDCKLYIYPKNLQKLKLNEKYALPHSCNIALLLLIQITNILILEAHKWSHYI